MSRGSSASAQCVDDFHPVTLSQHVFGVPATGDDVSVHFHRHAAFAQALGLQERGHSRACVNCYGFTIEYDVHAAIVAFCMSGGQGGRIDDAVRREACG